MGEPARPPSEQNWSYPWGTGQPPACTRPRGCRPQGTTDPERCGHTTQVPKEVRGRVADGTTHSGLTTSPKGMKQTLKQNEGLPSYFPFLSSARGPLGYTLPKGRPREDPHLFQLPGAGFQHVLKGATPALCHTEHISCVSTSACLSDTWFSGPSTCPPYPCL